MIHIISLMRQLAVQGRADCTMGDQDDPAGETILIVDQIDALGFSDVQAAILVREHRYGTQVDFQRVEFYEELQDAVDNYETYAKDYVDRWRRREDARVESVINGLRRLAVADMMPK